MRSFLLRGTAMACALFLSIPAHAEHNDQITSIDHPTVMITRGNVSAVGGGFLNPLVNPNVGSLTAPSINQKKEELSRVPGGVDLVPAEDYQDKYVVNLKDALNDVPGVFAEKRWGEEVRLSIRGSGLGRNFHLRGIQLYQDGIPINLADDSGDFQELDPLISRSIEVYKGANALQFGASSLGGAINVVTPTGITAQNRNEIRTEVGSYDTYRALGSVAREIGNADVFAAASGLTSRGWRDHNEQETARFNGNVGYRFNPAAETRFYLTYNNVENDVPGTITLQQALHDPRTVPAINITNDYARDVKSLRLANKTTFALDGNKKLDVGFYTLSKDLFHPIFQVIDQEYFTYGTFVRLKGSTQLLGHRNDYTVGTNARLGNIDAKQFTNIRGSRGVQTADQKQEAQNYDIFAENQFFLLPELALVTGAQALYANRDFTNNFVNTNNAQEDFTAFNPKLGFIYDTAKSVQFFGNVSRSYEAPTFGELVQAPVVGFVPLDAQKAWTVELGTRGTVDRYAFDLTLYRAWIEDELLSFTTNINVPAATFNAGDTVHQGVEFGFDVDLGKDFILPKDSVDRLILRNAYTLNDFFFENDAQFGDNRIAGIPEHLIKTELRYENKDGWFISPRIEWAPTGAFVDFANTLRAPSYFITNLGLGYKIRPNIELFADARNIFNERYASNFSTITNANTAPTNVFYPGEERSVYAGIKVGF